MRETSGFIDVERYYTAATQRPQTKLSELPQTSAIYLG